MSKFLYRPSGPVISRRQLLKGTAAIAGAAVASSVLPASLRRAAAKTLAYPTRSSLNDIKHIVVLMQENRSFDHYFGTFPGAPGLRPRRPSPCRAATPSSTSPTRAMPTATSCRSTTTRRRPRPRPRRAPTRPGQHSRRRGTAGKWTAGWRQRARSLWVISSRTTSPSSGHWRERSRYVTTTIAACSGRPTQTACTCGPVGSTRMGRPVGHHRQHTGIQ